MNLELETWLRALHFFGFLMWAGGTIGSLNILATEGADEPGRKLLAGLAAKTSRSMNFGALLAIAIGVYLAIALPHRPMSQPWMHVKLTLLLGLIGLTGYASVKGARLRKGKDGARAAGWSPVVAVLLTLIIIVVATTKPFIR